MYVSRTSLKAILSDAVAIGKAAARTIVWYPRTEGTMKRIEVFPGENSAWKMAYVNKNVFFNGDDGKTMNSDARTMFFHTNTGVTPCMAVSIPGQGSDYAIAFVDSEKQPFDGSRTYNLNIPANPPVNNFQSVTMYDSQTRSLLQSDQPFPALDSLSGQFKTNTDGSIDLYISPEAPPGMKSNRLQSVPGKGFFVALRMYGPLQPWIDKTWRPSEVEPVE